MNKLVKTSEQISKMRVSAKMLAEMMNEIKPMVKEGMIPLEIDNFAFDWIKDHGAGNAFLNYHDYPNTLCIGVNNMATHGIPTNIPFKNGDIVTIDAGLIFDGYFSDMARTYLIGDVAISKRKFVETVKSALEKAIISAKAGNNVGDISYAIHSTVTPFGYHPLVEYVGHGIGRILHDEPSIPGAYGKPGQGMLLEAGMTLAIETLVNMGKPKVITSKKDGWTTYTADGSVFCLWENTILVTETGGEILTEL